MPNGTYGGVRGRKITVVKKYYVIFLLLDCQEWFYLGGNWNGQDCRWGKPSLSDVSIFHTEPKSKLS